MTPADRYRQLAADLRAKAEAEDSEQLKAECSHLADCYMRLAEQADKNSLTDVTYEPILKPAPPDPGEAPA